jgi:hypothetical protein
MNIKSNGKSRFNVADSLSGHLAPSHNAMKSIVLAVLVVASGCSTPNPNPKATTAAYEQVKIGMSREQVYALLGQPKSVRPSGDIDHCRTAIWSIPHDSHGWGHWTVKFSGDMVSDMSNTAATYSATYSSATSTITNSSGTVSITSTTTATDSASVSLFH